MEMTRISVAMCTYNGSRFLPEQLASIAAQTRLPEEMVICDDGSTDATAEIVEAFAHTAPFPVRFIRNPQNLGSTKNFEKAIGLCTGDLIALCDQDDVWMPEKLARQAEMMENDPELGGVFSDAELMDVSSKRLGKQLWDSIQFGSGEQKQFQAGHGVDILLKRNVVTGATLMVRASRRPQFLPVPNIWVHDGWIAWMLVIHSQLRLIDEPLIQYRIHPNQQVGIESVSKTLPSTLLERLEIGKREEPAKHAAHARQLKELEHWIIAKNDAKSLALLRDLRRTTRFYEGRAVPSNARLARVEWVLRNAGNYYR